MRALDGRHLAASLLLSLTVACSAASPAIEPAQPASNAATELVREAQAFMESYARDLRAGERERLVARYDPRGAYLVGEGKKTLLSPDSIRAIYTGQWRPPASFEWRDLSYEVVGPDAVVVVGRFIWGVNAEQQIRVSYTGLLLRRNGELYIRLEDESAAPAAAPQCPPDSARG